MTIVGLTGGIGSGKSTALNFFKELGVATYSADIEAKKIMDTDPLLKKEIVELFGKEAYENSHLNSGYIASIVFKDSSKLKALNSLVHPKVRDHFKGFINSCKSDIVIYEAAILFESGGHAMCDFVITVTASLEEKIKRVMKRDGVSRGKVIERIQHQVNDDFKIKNSDYVIANNSLDGLKKQVKEILTLIKNKCIQ